MTGSWTCADRRGRRGIGPPKVQSLPHVARRHWRSFSVANKSKGGRPMTQPQGDPYA